MRPRLIYIVLPLLLRRVQVVGIIVFICLVAGAVIWLKQGGENFLSAFKDFRRPGAANDRQVSADVV